MDCDEFTGMAQEKKNIEQRIHCAFGSSVKLYPWKIANLFNGRAKQMQIMTWSPFWAEIARFLFFCVYYTSLIFKQMAVPAFFFFCADCAGILRIILDAFRVLPVISYLWICACLKHPIPSNKRGACAQEVPSDALEWVRKAWELQTWLNRRDIGTFCYFTIT